MESRPAVVRCESSSGDARLDGGHARLRRPCVHHPTGQLIIPHRCQLLLCIDIRRRRRRPAVVRDHRSRRRRRLDHESSDATRAGGATLTEPEGSRDSIHLSIHPSICPRLLLFLTSSCAHPLLLPPSPPCPRTVMRHRPPLPCIVLSSCAPTARRRTMIRRST
jgi:hypothetical protein